MLQAKLKIQWFEISRYSKTRDIREKIHEQFIKKSIEFNERTFEYESK